MSAADVEQDWLSPFYAVECPHCKWVGELSLNASSGLKVGDAVYHDSDRPNLERCPKCLRFDLVVLRTPAVENSETHEGFWKVPKS